MANPKTEQCIAAMVKAGLEEGIIYPFFFSPFYGQATTSAAVRVAKRRGLIEEANRYYTALKGGYTVGNLSAHDKMKYLAS